MQTDARRHDRLTVGVLYGFRALMVLFVCNYHIWQQGWLGQYGNLFGCNWDFDFWTRSSYLFVDGMILLSGFLLYLPHARQAEYHTPVPTTKRFYWNRLARIVPSYAISVLLMLIFFVLPNGSYRDAAARNFDIITHFTFTFTFFPETYLFSPINGVLWTVAIEMQFYLLFPLVAKAVRKRPLATLCAMAGLGWLFRLLMARYVTDLAIWVNQLPSFLDVYALGILGAILYVKLHKRLEQQAPHSVWKRWLGFATPVLFAAGCWALVSILHLQTNNGLLGPNELRLSQWLLRLPLALTLLLLMLSAAFLPRVLQKLLDNRLMRFLSTISFNLYIWHQVLSVQIARNLFPDTLHSNLQLQQAYTLLTLAVSILVAMAATYGVEQPVARLLERLRAGYGRKHLQPAAVASPAGDILSPDAAGAGNPPADASLPVSPQVACDATQSPDATDADSPPADASLPASSPMPQAPMPPLAIPATQRVQTTPAPDEPSPAGTPT